MEYRNVLKARLDKKCPVTQPNYRVYLRCCLVALGTFLTLHVVLQTINVSARSLRSFKPYKLRFSGTPSIPKYRIADGIKQLKDAPSCEFYPQSLVCAYQRKTSDANDLVTLSALLDSEPFSTYEKPKKGVVIAHLRLGDALCAQFDPQCRGTVTSVPDCWENSQDCWIDRHLKRQYAFSKSWYEKTIRLLEPGQVIELFYNMHH